MPKKKDVVVITTPRRESPRTPEEIEADKEIEIYRPTKADLFADAYIRNRFNATQAALEVFDIEGDEKQRLKTAASVGYEYLRKPVVQDILTRRKKENDVSIEWVMGKLKDKLDECESDDTFFRALDRIAHFVGAEIKERSTDVSANRNPQLNLYMNLQNQLDKPAKVIDVDAQST